MHTRTCRRINSHIITASSESYWSRKKSRCCFATAHCIAGRHRQCTRVPQKQRNLSGAHKLALQRSLLPEPSRQQTRSSDRQASPHMLRQERGGGPALHCITVTEQPEAQQDSRGGSGRGAPRRHMRAPALQLPPSIDGKMHTAKGLRQAMRRESQHTRLGPTTRQSIRKEDTCLCGGAG